MLDTVRAVETPEGVRLALRAAGPVPRAIAFSVDSMLRSVVYAIALVGLATMLGDLAVPLTILLVFLGEWFYPVFFEVWSEGQTPGKRLVGVRVVMQDGTRVGWSASILRNLLLAADWLPGTYAAGLVTSLSSRDFRRLGDLAAGTFVIHVERPPAAAVVPRGAPSTPLAPPFPLTLDEQRAVIAFAERAPLLSPERAAELAALAQPLHGAEPPSAQRIERIGAWLLGRGASEAP